MVSNSCVERAIGQIVVSTKKYAAFQLCRRSPECIQIHVDYWLSILKMQDKILVLFKEKLICVENACEIRVFHSELL